MNASTTIARLHLSQFLWRRIRSSIVIEGPLCGELETAIIARLRVTTPNFQLPTPNSRADRDSRVKSQRVTGLPRLSLSASAPLGKLGVGSCPPPLVASWTDQLRRGLAVARPNPSRGGGEVGNCHGFAPISERIRAVRVLPMWYIFGG